MAADRLRELQALLTNQSISGFALISQNGSVECAYGSLEDALWPTNGSDSSHASSIRQILAAFSGDPPTHIEIAGSKVVVVRQEDGYVYAISKHNALGISLHYHTSGILVVAYSKAQQASVGRLRSL